MGITRSQCTVKECNRKVHGRGLCGMHYSRWRANGDPTTSKYARTKPSEEWVIAKFLSQVEKTGTCWFWRGMIARNGYGAFHIPGPNKPHKTVRAHRFSYKAFKGKLPDFDPRGLRLDHTCRNRHCVNPDHLELVSAQVNVARSWPATKPQCKHGHLFTPENTRIYRGERKCRACARIRARKIYQPRPQAEITTA